MMITGIDIGTANPATSYVGVNVGALTVKVAAIRGDTRSARVLAHQGRPLKVLDELLASTEFSPAAYFGVSGHLGHIAEVAAIQRALREVAGEFDAVVSLGGESFLVYILEHGRISNVLSHNKCAAGSGEFFVQQIGRMGLGIDEAIARSVGGNVVPLASRCSVHCKSDITHKLNRKEASAEDILRTLHDSMANKVVALLEKVQRELRRVLVIGGMTRNTAMLAALREKVSATQFVVLPESAWFEAWGSALLARDNPLYRSPRILRQSPLGSLPPLNQYAERVQVIAAPARQPPPAGPLVLGVDAGSTTTKAILLDPTTRNVVASHYTRTRGDPIAAVRECLRALVAQVGNRHVGLEGTTGSARELAGAYLGTEYVYNEISAHAAGATHFDADVDTIFEIGGQDAKYIYLRNGVPIDYAMNNACSAGTGSFLEECAQSDLGITVSDIADIALAAPSPVHFKATCAAFINSDIRVAQQQGQSRDNIVSGLVYAIAGNYLNRVKGPRSVGKKVFLQGGVALNRALGYAFAHSVSHQVLIPPNPELLGALGVALLALARRGGALKPLPECEHSSTEESPQPERAPDSGADLLTLAAPEMKLVGRVTCRACTLNCSIDRFEVAGRRFPFGGRCSLFENVWKRKSSSVATPDLVQQRAEILFGCSSAEPVSSGTRIGIPRALTTHSLFPLYSVFFSSLGMEVVLSDVDPSGDLKSNSGFCFPAQIAHGAVLDLSRRGVDWVFLPHVVRMPRQPDTCRDSYLCPITQAGPYFLAKAFPAVRLLSPVLDFTDGYEASAPLAELIVREFGIRRESVDQAWAAAVHAQREAERALANLGQRALDQAVAAGKPAILLAGHSYNAFTPDASQSVGKKLSSMGVPVIPADCLPPVGEGPTAWHFANQILNAVALAKQHPNLFILCVSNFSCTIDAFTHAMVASEMGAKPYLILEIDAHTADAGVQTRLEAFLDIANNYREAQAGRAQSFTPCRLTAGGQVIRSNGEQVPITDPRVRLYFPNFSQYHAQALAMATSWLGLHAGEVITLGRSQLDRGLHYTSGRECLPLPICVGQLLQIHENRGPGEIAGFYMIPGGAPCVSESYKGYIEQFITDQQLPDLFLLSLQAEEGSVGSDKTTFARCLASAILAADILVEIDHVLQVVGVRGSVDRLREEWRRFAVATRSLDEFHAELPGFIDRLAALPRTRDPLTCPRVVVTGDFFTRFSPFFMEGVTDLYAERGIILKPVDLSELLLYLDYYRVAETANGWGMKPGGLALGKACTRVLQRDGKHYLQKWLTYQTGRLVEDYYRRLFRKTGLLVAGPNDVSSLFEGASEHVSHAIYGEITPTVGKGLDANRDGYDGIIVIGPFNCLPYRISEAILRPVSLQRGMPILTYESDGYAVSPSVLRQVDVHVQQVLDHAAGRRDRSPVANDGLAGFLTAAVRKWR
ncbi:MAG: anhydro-N-acetylmuramic acid kinase [Betaproteobacteria bacterium]|nr:anhydro-N-acetylmuramic acid kinase [Betaproteobacteria bacterium]MDH3435391.1 anhydro-N-acetylmuramic acid kinase [Betaproteobacteria bacterium]